MKTYKPNQSGNISNRTAFHDSDTEEKLFVVEFYTDNIELRRKIVNEIRALPGMVKHLETSKEITEMLTW